MRRPPELAAAPPAPEDQRRHPPERERPGERRHTERDPEQHDHDPPGRRGRVAGHPRSVALAPPLADRTSDALAPGREVCRSRRRARSGARWGWVSEQPTRDHHDHRAWPTAMGRRDCVDASVTGPWKLTRGPGRPTHSGSLRADALFRINFDLVRSSGQARSVQIAFAPSCQGARCRRVAQGPGLTARSERHILKTREENPDRSLRAGVSVESSVGNVPGRQYGPQRVVHQRSQRGHASCRTSSLLRPARGQESPRSALSSSAPNRPLAGLSRG
jgi:hypothetical protein